MDRTQAVPTVETYAKKYPDVPAEVILKEDLLRLGLTFTPEALQLAEGCRPQAYFLFSYNISGPEELGANTTAAAPEDIVFCGGPYGLKRTYVRAVLSAHSPYTIAVVDGRPAICEHDIPVAEVIFPDRPAYYGKTFADGTRYEQVVPLLYDHYAFITTFRVCHYWGMSEECKFCDINHHVRSLRKLKGDHVSPQAVKDPEKVATVVAEMVRGASAAHRVVTVLMTSGSILRDVQGRGENAADFNIPYVEAIRARIGGRLPIVLITESQPLERVKRLRAAGVTVHNANLEVWDKELFAILAPGKAKYVGYDLWVRRLLDAVEIMGEGNVSPNMVSGIEMAQPWGFKRVDEAVRSATEGFEFLMSHGVIPHLDTWCIEPGTQLEGHPPVPLDFLIRADAAWHETWKKYNLPPFAGYGPMGGPGRALYGNSASVDIGP
jgi:hypothetical protein